MKRYILVFVMILGLMMVTTSCSLDPNEDPNTVLADQATPELRLAAAETSAYSIFASSMNGLGNYWMNTWSGDFSVFGNPATVESNLELSTTFYQGIFTSTYRAVTRFQRIIDYPDANTNYPNYVAIAKIQKAFYMQYMVDLYGDVPYSEAFKETENITPKYDDDVTVYQGLVQELNDAIGLINTSNPGLAVKASSDPIFKGDMSKWKRFANTILLRFAVRMSNTTNADGIALRNSIISSLSGAAFITDDVTINPGYSGESDSKLNPLYDSFGLYTAAGAVDTQAYYVMCMSKHIIESLLGNTSITTGVSDPRISFLATKCYIYDGGANASGIGYDSYLQGNGNPEFKTNRGYAVSDPNPTASNISLLAGPFNKTPAVGGVIDGVLMFKADAELLQAEAAVRGYAGFSGGATHFTNAINASFAFDGMTPADASTYISAISSKPQVGWTGGTSDKVAAIQYQRWIALANFDGIESYINYLRTGYPVTPLATTTTRPNKPWRLLYPAAEYSANSANVPDVPLADIFTKNQHTPFIYQ